MKTNNDASMKKDYIYILIFAVLVIMVLYFAKTKETMRDDFDIYKEVAEKRITVIQDSFRLGQIRLDSIIQNMDSLSKIDKSKKENLKIVYVEGKKERIRVVSLDTSAAIWYFTDRVYRERFNQDTIH